MLKFKDFSTIMKPNNTFDYLPEEIILLCDDAIYISMVITGRLYTRDSFDAFIKESEEKGPKRSISDFKRYVYENAFGIASTKELAKHLRTFYKRDHKDNSNRRSLKVYFFNRGDSIKMVFENDVDDYLKRPNDRCL